jgi:hypothetical protein
MPAQQVPLVQQTAERPVQQTQEPLVQRTAVPLVQRTAVPLVQRRSQRLVQRLRQTPIRLLSRHHRNVRRRRQTERAACRKRYRQCPCRKPRS